MAGERVRDSMIPVGYVITYHDPRAHATQEWHEPHRAHPFEGWYEARVGSRVIGGYPYKDMAVDACREDAGSDSSAPLRYKIIGGGNSAVDAPTQHPAGRCNVCGRCTNEVDGSPVTWQCRSCKQPICRGCTLMVPGLTEYFSDTLCSRACWDAAGRPDE